MVFSRNTSFGPNHELLWKERTCAWASAKDPFGTIDLLGPTIIDGKTLTAWSYAAVAIELFRRIVHFETKVVDSDESFESFCRFVMRKILPRELMMLAFDDWPKRGVTNGNRLMKPQTRESESETEEMNKSYLQVS